MRRASSTLRLGVVALGLAAPACRAGAEGVEPQSAPRPAQGAARAGGNGESVAYELTRSPFGLHVISKDLDGPVEIGARWTRHLVLWKQAEPRKGAIVDFEPLVRPLNALTDAGFEVLPRVVSVAPWAYPERVNRLNVEAARQRLPMGDWTYLAMPTDVASYRRFLTTIVEAFDGDGFKDAAGLKKGIKYWQVENEWDWRWKDSPQGFVDFLRIAYETIKAADPDARVVLGGISKLAPDAFHAGLLGESIVMNGRTITPESLAKQAYFREEHPLRTYVLEQGYPYFDILSFHQYGRYRAIEKEIEYVRGIMRRRGYERPLWMTEAGGPFVPYGEEYTEDRHAQEVVKYYVTALASGVEVVFWSTYQPTPEWGTAFTNTALLDASGRKKPAYYSYKLLASTLQGAVRVQRLISAPRGQLVVFTRKSGERVYVAWREGGPQASAAAPERLVALLDEKVKGRILRVTGYDGEAHSPERLRRELGALLARGPIFVEAR